MTDKKIIAVLILLGVLIAAGFFIFSATQKKVEQEIVVNQSVISSVEQSILAGFREQLEILKPVDTETLKLMVRHTYPNYTMIPGSGNFTLRGSVHGLFSFFWHQHEINGSEELAKEVLDWAMNVTAENGGIFPGFDAGCIGAYLVHGMISSGLPKDHELIKKMLESMKELRVPDGGWVVLDYSKAKKPDGTPYDISSTEVNPTMIAAFLKAGYSLNDSLIKQAIKANDGAILKSAYMKEYYPDYILGNAWSIILYKEIGISKFDAFRKARNELIDLVLAKPDPNNTYIIGCALLALQGVIPNSSTPYRNSVSMMMNRYDKNTSRFLAGDSPIFGAEFSKTADSSLAPLFALKKVGYNKRWFNLSLPENPPCGEITRVGDKMIVKSENPPDIEWTENDFITIKNATMNGGSGSYEYTPPAKPFHVVMNCTSYYWVSGWYS